jgi:hypothetical protein
MHRLMLIVSLALAAPLAAQQDSSYAAMQARGHMAMGVDQYSSWHHFDPLPDGGRISLQRDSLDSTGVAEIRMHLQHIAMAFAQGDFDLPGFVHAQEVPGTRVMAAKRAAIRYAYHPLAGGGEVLITSADAAAVRAVHDFLAFQRKEHRVGAEGTPHR